MSGSTQHPVFPPMGVGQILDRVFRLTRANLKLFVGIASVPPIAMFGLFVLGAGSILIPLLRNPHSGITPNEVPALVFSAFSVVLVVVCIHWFVFALYSAAASYAAVRADRGLPATFRESYAVAWNHAGRYILLLLLIYLVCFFPALLIELPVFVSFGLAAMHKAQPNPLLFALLPLTMLLQMAASVVGFILMLRFSLSFPASVFENLSARQALKRSGTLTRGAKGRTFLVLLVIYAAMYLGIIVLECGAMLIGAIVYFAGLGLHIQPSTPALVVLAICGGIGLLAVMMLYMACSWAGFASAFAIIYNNQLVCMEGSQANLLPSGVPAW